MGRTLVPAGQFGGNELVDVVARFLGCIRINIWQALIHGIGMTGRADDLQGNESCGSSMLDIAERLWKLFLLEEDDSSRACKDCSDLRDARHGCYNFH